MRHTITATTYERVPFAAAAAATRGAALTSLARRIDEALHQGEAFEEAESGMRVDGKRCGPNTAGYDWLRVLPDGERVRVACRSAQLKWDTSNRNWILHYGGAKASDEVLLATFTPRGVYLHRRPATVGPIRVLGPSNEADWEAALDGTLLTKLDSSGAERLDFVPFSDARMVAAMDAHPPTPTAAAFEAVPLADSSGIARGRALAAIAREVDGRLHPKASFDDDVGGVPLRSGRQVARYDWRRDGVRVACRSAQLKWEAYHRQWVLQFQNLPQAAGRPFDELLLAAYTPHALYLYRHDGELGVAKQGKRTAARQIKLYGPSGEAEWRIAFDETLWPKLEARCECVAVVRWNSVTPTEVEDPSCDPWAAWLASRDQRLDDEPMLDG